MKIPLPLRAVVLVGALLALGFSGCATSLTSKERPLYFATPQAAIETATPLLQAKNWARLARYYDLSGSAVAREELANGSFFYSDRVEGLQHPAGLSRYKHPFAPGFRFLRTEAGPQPGTWKVIAQIEIDQGAGLPPQRGLSAFLLRQSEHGYRFLPTKVDP